jgi:hypothetical protein
MKYVILRDDDTNALTPVEYLDRLYRPFLDRQLPVNLAVIPNVRTDVTYGDNILEGFLVARNGTKEKMVPIGSNNELISYLRQNPGFKLAQHGYNHEFVNGWCEFEHHNSSDLARRLDNGAKLFREAGFPQPETFVAPYDLFSRRSFAEVARRFRVISTAWFEWGRLPRSWWPRYLLSRVSGRSHWQVGRTILLSHPRCYLSWHHPYATMLSQIRESIQSRKLTVLVTHWWEFFRDNQPDEAFIAVLHQLADYLASADDIEVITFEQVSKGNVPLS